MSYKIEINERRWATAKNKDEVIGLLMGYINGDGIVPIKVIYNDGSYIEFEGETDD
jgi:hypothetical protein